MDVRLGLRDQEARWLATVVDSWGHRQAQVYMEVTVLTKSRRRSCKSSGGFEDLAPEQSRTTVTRVELDWNTPLVRWFAPNI